MKKSGLGLGTLKEALNLPQNDREWEDWAIKNKSLGPDYDYSKMGPPDPRGHGSDKGKLPNHPTFSDQSYYAEKGNPGQWLKMRDGKDYFEPSPEQLNEFGQEYYNEYSRRTGDNIRIPLPIENQPGLVDVSGLATLPFKSAFAGLKGIQLLKDVALARKASYAAERAKNTVDAKKFAAGVGLTAENLYSMNGK